MTDPAPHSPETDLDAATAAAWFAFIDTLTALIEQQGSRAIGVFVEEGPATVNRIRLDQADGDLWVILRGNTGLPPSLRLSRSAMAHARRLGWSRASSASRHYARYFPATTARTAAFAIATALSEVVGVLHPAFVSLSDDLRPIAPTRPAASPRAQRPSPSPAMATAPRASGLRPTSPRHLDRLVESTLGTVMGRELRRSECGEIDIDVDGGTVYVEWSTDRLVVPLVTPLATSVAGGAATLAVVNDLNRYFRGITFVLEGRSVVARIDHLANPFDGDLLVNHLSLLCALVTDHGASIAERLGALGDASDRRGG